MCCNDCPGNGTGVSPKLGTRLRGARYISEFLSQAFLNTTSFCFLLSHPNFDVYFFRQNSHWDGWKSCLWQGWRCCSQNWEQKSLNCVSSPALGKAAASFLLPSPAKSGLIPTGEFPPPEGHRDCSSGGGCCSTKLTPEFLAPCVGSTAVPSRAWLGAAASPAILKMSFSSPKESFRWVVQAGGCIPSWN